MSDTVAHEYFLPPILLESPIKHILRGSFQSLLSMPPGSGCLKSPLKKSQRLDPLQENKPWMTMEHHGLIFRLEKFQVERLP